MISLNNITALYVSQNNGNDDFNGFYTKHDIQNNGPFKTLEKAISTVAKMRNQGFVQPVTIKITDSVYIVSKPVVIDNNVSLVTIEPYDECEIRGGIEINNFEKSVYNGCKCLCADVSHLQNMEFSDFYVNGKFASVTRYPKQGTLSPKDAEFCTEDFFLGSKWFTAKDEDFEVIKNFKNIEDAYISYYHYWIDEHSPIESFDEKDKKIVMKYVSRFNITPSLKSANIDYVIENVGEMFSEPGQWYCDKKQKKLYYIPENWDEKVKGYIPFVDKLFVINGTDDKKVKNVYINNFSLGYTKGEYKSTFDEYKYTNPSKKDGFASDIQSVCNGHGSIEFNNAVNCGITNCKLNCLGVHAINVKSGCSDIDIKNNNITHIGAGGVYVSGGAYGSDKSTHTHHIDISDNTICYCGRRYYAACGVVIRHGYDCTILHNEIANLYYTGISCGWVWGFADNITCNNKIEKNYIHNLGGGILSDMGGIYTLGKQPGTTIRGNVVHDVTSRHYGGWALYTDEGSTGIVVENNVCYNTSNNVYHQHYGSMNTVRNNIFAFSKDAVIRHSRNDETVGIICENNIIVTSGNAAFRLRDMYPGKIKSIKSRNNFVFNYTNSDIYVSIVGDDKDLCYDEVANNANLYNCEDTFSGDYNINDAINKLCMEEGSVFINPEFEDVKNYNFNLKPTSPVYKLGFKPIDTSDVGPRK